MFPFIMLIISLLSSFDHMLALFPPPVTSMYDSSPRSKHTHTTFSARLIHRSSPESPFFDPNYTRTEHIKNSELNSQARSRYFSRSGKNYVAAPVTDWTFTMKYFMGTPPVDKYGILDTGSSLIWFQCLPCNNCSRRGKIPIFDPRQSTSFQRVFCYTRVCDKIPGQMCWNSYSDYSCRYNVAYVQGTSQGIIATETLTLSAGDTTATVNKVVFGCANNNQKLDDVPGIVGLANHSFSLLQQLSVSHFSYFLFANGSDISGEAHFGPGASLSSSGFNTPFIPSDDGLYYLNLIGISVDGSDLDLPPGFFDKSMDDYGVKNGFIIDSGTTYTSLVDEAFDKLKDAIADEMYMYTQVKHKASELCFEGYEGGAPEVAFQFKGLDYTLCDSNLWIKKKDGLSCLAIVRSKDRDSKISILGIHQQRNVQVGYDLEKNLLTLNYRDACPNDVIDFLQ